MAILTVMCLNSCYEVHSVFRMHQVKNSYCHCDSQKRNYKTTFKNEKKRTGMYVQYNDGGCIITHGRYVKGKKRGLWEYYNRIGCPRYFVFYSRNDSNIRDSIVPDF